MNELNSHERLIAAAQEVIECMRVLHKSGSNLVAEVLRDQEFIEWEHCPSGDVYDPESRSQYYFHAHPASETRFSDYGHFHTFLRSGAAAASTGEDEQNLENGEICHLVGISMTREGFPERLFTVNRWVTGENWRPAAETAALVDKFEIDLTTPSWPLNRWLTAMVALYRPEICKLIEERDRKIAAWQERHPGTDVFEDRALEITSMIPISLEKKARELGV